MTLSVRSCCISTDDISLAYVPVRRGRSPGARPVVVCHRGRTVCSGPGSGGRCPVRTQARSTETPRYDVKARRQDLGKKMK